MLFLRDATHLLNVDRLQLIAFSLKEIGKMQRRNYDLCCVQMVQICLLRQFHQGQNLSSSNSSQWSKFMYEKSLKAEGLVENISGTPTVF